MAQAKGISGEAGETPLTISGSGEQRESKSVKPPASMNPLAVIKAIGVLLLMAWAVATLTTWVGEEAELDGVPRVTMDDFVATYHRAFMQSQETAKGNDHGIFVIDVRGEEAYISDHIRGAVSIPEGDVQARIREVVPDLASKVVLYCA